MEGPQSVLHKGKKLILHFWRKVLITYLIIPQEKLLKLTRGEVIQPLLNMRIHPLPKLLITTLQLLHEVVHRQIVLLLNPVEICTNEVKSLRNPDMSVPIVVLLTLHLRQVPKSLDHLLVFEVL